MKNSAKVSLMGHIVGGYPNKDLSIQAALGICEGGASYLEVQFPFSDPSADGPIIEEACNVALKNGFTIDDGFEIVQILSHQSNTKILIMTYANIIFSYGVLEFVKKAKICGAKALIVPDLPYESDEKLREIAKSYEIGVIELIAPGADAKRIQKLSKVSKDFVYVVARTGTTGKKTQINEKLFEWLEFVKSHCDKKIALGFGIYSNEQVVALQDIIDIVIAGSYFVKKINSRNPQENIRDTLKNHTAQLIFG